MVKLHREGKTTIPISILVIALLVAAAYWIHPVLGHVFALAGAVLVFLVFNFFRNPTIQVVEDDTKVLAPCDGKVVVIEEVEDNIYFNDKRMQVSIFMSPLNVHVNRNPIGGVIKFAKYYPGKYLMAFNPKSSELNEQSYIVAENEKLAVGYKQIAGFLARRIIYYVKEGDVVKQGEEFGFIKFGSRIDLLLPLSSNISVKLGDKVKAGITVVAEV
ncbi:MAG: phosphatidylserine decarboxylase family protein [Bacteroidetes bacterium]|nr:MAG: phosphatidylserine decarboxylase family protein [Bacteroidota bacterium]